MQKKLIGFIKKNWVVISVLLVAFIVRVVGVYPGFTVDHPDEPGSYIAAINMFYNFLMPGRFDYPAGMPLLHLLIYVIFILPFVFLKIFFLHPSTIFALFHLGFNFFTQFKEDIFGTASLNALYWSRYIAAVIGTGAVVLVYFTTKKLFTKSAGIFAALFLAFNFRHVLASHFGLPDIHSSFFNILTLFACVLLFEKNTRRRYIFAGITAALALSIKYQPFAYIPFFVVHFLWAFKKKSFWYLFNINFIFAIIVSFITFAIVNPYYLFNIENAMLRNSQDYVRYGMGQLYLRAYQYFYLFNWGIGKLPSIAIMLGIISMLFLKFRKFLIIFSFVGAFFFVTTYYSSAYPRNFTAVVPYLMIFAGFFMDILYKGLKKINIKLGTVLIILILAILNFSSIKNSIILDLNYSKPWKFVELNEWLGKYLPPKTIVRAYDISPTYQTQLALKSKNIQLKDWDFLLENGNSHSVAEFQKEGTQFAILQTEIFQVATYQWRTWTDYKRYFGYNNIPFDYIQNGFFGLSQKELMKYAVYEIYKPWQAQDQKNYLVFKIPEKPRELGERIAMFTFDKGEEGWKPINLFNFSPLAGGWIKDEGKSSLGALFITSGGDATERLTSLPIKIRPGYLYTVRGSLKSKLLSASKERDGFLRVDFYKNKNEADKGSLGESVALSSRAYKTGGWEEEEANLVAPKDAQYLRISFQRATFQGGPIYVDDVELFENAAKPEEPFPILPYIKPSIPLESIYYNSFL